MKKILILIGALFVIGVLTSCGETTTIVNTDPLEAEYDSLIISSEIDDSTLLAIDSGDVTIEWSGTPTGIINRNGSINVPDSDTALELVALLIYGERTMIKVFNVTVLAVIVDANGCEVDETYINNECVPNTLDPVCGTGETLVDGECVTDTVDPTCGTGETLVAGECVTDTVDPTCGTGETLVDGECVTDTVDPNAPVYTGSYYDGVGSVTGDTLKAVLHDLIDGHTTLNYTAARDALTYTDEDPFNNNNVILIYTGDSIPKTYICSSSCPNDSWNREHVWPQSLGGFTTSNGPGTDIHSLRPSDVTVNSTRGSLYFDEGGNIVYNDGVATDNFYDSNSFEPRDEIKGDIARMVFYMAVRYEGDDGFNDLEINEITGVGVLSVLLQWHIDDPVDDFEMNRNNVIESYQHNRNPFIDHPEYVESIWGN